jgi:hypothetical protein
LAALGPVRKVPSESYLTAIDGAARRDKAPAISQTEYAQRLNQSAVDSPSAHHHISWGEVVSHALRVSALARELGLVFDFDTAFTGTHVGTLWSASGAVLAQATFSGETASGWQQVNFATPVAITANTVYVASYLAPAGRYAADTGYFNAGADNAPLHALRDGVSGSNGVYAYASSTVFPTATYNATNYWVDVVFSTTAVTPPPPPPPPVADTTAPTVTATSPAAGATGISRTANLTATFSEPMQAASITAASFELRGPTGLLIPAVVTYNATSRVATLNPTPTLATLTAHTVVVHGGGAAAVVRDAAGNALAADRSWTFTTR